MATKEALAFKSLLDGKELKYDETVVEARLLSTRRRSRNRRMTTMFSLNKGEHE